MFVHAVQRRLCRVRAWANEKARERHASEEDERRPHHAGKVRRTLTPRTWKSPCPCRSTDQFTAKLGRNEMRERETHFEVLEVWLGLGVGVGLGEDDVFVGLWGIRRL